MKKKICPFCNKRKAEYEALFIIEDETIHICGTCKYNIRIFIDTGLIRIKGEKNNNATTP